MEADPLGFKRQILGGINISYSVSYQHPLTGWVSRTFSDDLLDRVSPRVDHGHTYTPLVPLDLANLMSRLETVNHTYDEGRDFPPGVVEMSR